MFSMWAWLQREINATFARIMLWFAPAMCEERVRWMPREATKMRTIIAWWIYDEAMPEEWQLMFSHRQGSPIQAEVAELSLAAFKHNSWEIVKWVLKDLRVESDSWDRICAPMSRHTNGFWRNSDVQSSLCPQSLLLRPRYEDQLARRQREVGTSEPVMCNDYGCIMLHELDDVDAFLVLLVIVCDRSIFLVCELFIVCELCNDYRFVFLVCF